MNHKLEFLNIDLILPTEHIIAANLVNVKLNIFRDGAIKVPLCVEKTHKVLMDGHHRLEILKELGCPVAPVVFFDYEEVIVVEWEDRSKRIPLTRPL